MLALGLALGIQAFIVKPYQIPSESMEPTLDVGQRVLVNRFLYHFTDPSIGDIVVFHPPAGAERGNECGCSTLRARPAREPTRRSPIRTSSSGSSPARGTRSRSATAIPVVNGVEKTDEPYIIPCAGARRLQPRSARSPFHPTITS